MAKNKNGKKKEKTDEFGDTFSSSHHSCECTCCMVIPGQVNRSGIVREYLDVNNKVRCCWCNCITNNILNQKEQIIVKNRANKTTPLSSV